jgi:hypothetical protein
MIRSSRTAALGATLLGAGLLLAFTPDSVRWGRDGHVLVGMAAAALLPDDMPAFFRGAVDQLGWLNFDPDRWRDDRMVESNEAFQYDHFIDLEAVPDAALAAPHRFAYLALLSKSGIARPEQLGLLPFRILELTERLTVEFRQWRQATDARERSWIEQRIISDAGILGHYVADGSNPHHSTIHFNGWDATTANPDGYTTDRTFHRRFEADFVSAAIRLEDVRARAVTPARELLDLRADVLAYLRRTNAQLRRLYDLEKQEAFSATTRSAEHKAFAVDRLAAGADMLRSVWYTAWKNSGLPR